MFKHPIGNIKFYLFKNITGSRILRFRYNITLKCEDITRNLTIRNVIITNDKLNQIPCR